MTIETTNVREPQPLPVSLEPAPARVLSIDALRGFVMFWLIGGHGVAAALTECGMSVFKNRWPNPTAVELCSSLRTQFNHVDWQGFHFLDLIYPMFLLIIGVVLPFSLLSYREQSQPRWCIYWRILKRSLLLVLLGAIPAQILLFHSWPNMGGVLQHIAICYFLAAIITLHTTWRSRLFLVLGFLTVYMMALAWVPVPGHGAGVITREDSLGSYLDSRIISGGLWNEGPTSTFSGVCLILCGCLAGQWLKSDRTGNRKSLGLAAVGAVAVLLGYVCSFWIPMIKNILWTSSYVMFACGWSLLLLAAFYWIIDVRGYKRWATFFAVIGANAITIYFLVHIVNFDSMAHLFFGGIVALFGPILQPTAVAISNLTLKWLFLAFLYRRKIFLRV